ncbi:hypothetical protein KDX38_27400 [Pseudomonas sp. CDFA 602]|uniref:hypothetical protein n=1 Tax=Pseudomonas californiensis TaxID=2829823 RepID=UPI001E604EB6|nr:hypothetical protein [Pseudomonas californiensis]MCD5997294.1 hypothetical protein [Pseudomonas californiensis]MCD6002890.1 hypothetical protein [Pseudomonas californiensis]
MTDFEVMVMEQILNKEQRRIRANLGALHTALGEIGFMCKSRLIDSLGGTSLRICIQACFIKSTKLWHLAERTTLQRWKDQPDRRWPEV